LYVESWRRRFRGGTLFGFSIEFCEGQEDIFELLEVITFVKLAATGSEGFKLGFEGIAGELLISGELAFFRAANQPDLSSACAVNGLIGLNVLCGLESLKQLGAGSATVSVVVKERMFSGQAAGGGIELSGATSGEEPRFKE
jgi:hypothetical protein